MARADRLLPMKQSTRSFTREARKIPAFSLFDWLHGYVYSRWPYLYIGVGTGEHRLAPILGPLWERLSRYAGNATGDSDATPGEAFANGYHGKVVRTDDARLLVTLDEEIDIRDLEKIIPYSRARDIVLRNPDHIVALDCPCRASRPDPCLPLDVCLIVGEPFASFIREHQPDRSRWITQQEAVDILHAEHARGHVHHAFFKDAMLERFYAICNCCACCCGAMQACRHGVPMLAPSGYVSFIDEDVCLACGTCTEACPFDAISMGDWAAAVDEELCMGCGVCVEACPSDAHTLVRDPAKGEPLEIRGLMAEQPQPRPPA